MSASEEAKQAAEEAGIQQGSEWFRPFCKGYDVAATEKQNSQVLVKSENPPTQNAKLSQRSDSSGSTKFAPRDSEILPSNHASEKSRMVNLGMNVDKTSAFGSRFNMYRLQFAGYAWNPTLREWEVFLLDEDGSIQDLCDRYSRRADAIERAQEIENRERA